MNSQFDNKRRVNKFLRLEELQRLYRSFIEEAYNIMHTDCSDSDYLYFEAYKLKRQMVPVKANNETDFHANF
ncbi:Lacal_2735 family protein [Formosa sp. S-31]|uniref:Lacal_2735 family protein n=1 Tax=Formosa sp. S-31 TaxID=2790949 RepID=UPI003EBC81E3